MFSKKHESSRILKSLKIRDFLYLPAPQTFIRPYANPDFAKSEAAFSKTMFERRRRRSEFGLPVLGFASLQISGKIAGFAYSLDFLVLFFKKKGHRILNFNDLKIPLK